MKYLLTLCLCLGVTSTAQAYGPGYTYLGMGPYRLPWVQPMYTDYRPPPQKMMVRGQGPFTVRSPQQLKLIEQNLRKRGL